MDEYFDLMFGNAAGHVAVAYKGPRDSWHEQQFEWPTDRSKLLWWAKQHARGHLFICPALRADAHTRKKGDGINLRWLWADVDWDKVPTDKHAVVRKRIAQLGTYVVASGTADNVHVYVRLTKAVDVAEHFRLNTGLRDYLYADAKHADNSLLRLPGSTNWKTNPGVLVTKSGGHGKRVSPDALMRLRAFARVRGTGTAGVVDWVSVDTSDVPRRLIRLAKMESDEAIGRYGSRHRAVWAVVGDLHGAGLTVDQIHTLMDEFRPAKEKRDDEHGAYDVHKDVARRLFMLQEAQRAIDEGGDWEGAIEELTEQEQQALDVPESVRKILARRKAMREALRIEAEESFTPPPTERVRTLADLKLSPPDPMKYLIKDILGVKHNGVLIAQWKTGKTTFAMDLVKSLVDGDPFLGQFEITKRCRVVFWSLEVEMDELTRDFALPMQFQHDTDLLVFDGVGHGVNILTEAGKKYTVAQLNGYDVWVIDSLSVLAVWAGVNIDKDNVDTRRLFAAIDEIKARSGVQVSFVLAHTPRAEMQEGKERARGASAIDEHAGARWILTEDGGVRFLSVNGRGVALRQTSLVFDAETKRSAIGGETRAELADENNVQAVVTLVRGAPGLSKLKLTEMVKRRLNCGAAAARDAIEESVENGWLEVRRETRSGGGRATVRHYPAGSKNNGGATPRAVNFRKVGSGERRVN